MSIRGDFRAMTRKALPASSGAALVHDRIPDQILGRALGGLLLLSAP